MMLRSFCLAATLILPSLAAAQGVEEADMGPAIGMTEAPSMDAGLESGGLPILPPGKDAHGRDKDPMQVDADAGQRPAGGDDAMLGAHRDSIIQGSGATIPEGTHGAVPIGGGASVADMVGFDVALSGFLQVEGALSLFDNDEYKVSFLPREIELDLVARHDAGATLRLDINLISSPEAALLSSPLERQVDLIDELVEQAYVEWSRDGFTLRGGKMNAPFGGEPLDAHDRIDLSRSTLSKLATPDLLTGFYGRYDIMPEVGAYIIAVNGWDLTVDGNRSKTLGGGVPHRFISLPDGGWLYEGDLSFIAGAERPGTNDLRWLLDYSAKVRVLNGLNLALELVYAQEDGEGYNKGGMKDGVHAADWYGGMLTVDYEVPENGPAWLDGWAGALRMEYIRDRDLAIGLPHAEGVQPDQTTLFGTAMTLRFELAHGIQAVAEYKVDFERADVEGFRVLRYFPDESYNVFKWFITQEVILGLVGSF